MILIIDIDIDMVQCVNIMDEYNKNALGDRARILHEIPEPGQPHHKQENTTRPRPQTQPECTHCSHQASSLIR